jgi:hypothetical protein
MVARFDPESPDQCLKLPPSLELGHQVFDLRTGRIFSQPSITYCLRAVVTFGAVGSSNSESLETHLPIILTPHTEELPPTETNDFPSDFIEQESKVLRRTLIGTTLGILKICLTEPPPLSYDKASTYSATSAVLKLEFWSRSSSNNTLNILGGLKFKVYSLVRVKTFYSVKPFPRPPSQCSLSTQSDTRLRDDIVKLGAHTVANPSWGYRFDLDNQAMEDSRSHSIHTIPSPGSSINEVTRHKTLEAKSPESNSRWISNWDVPIQVDGRLLPTFCSALVARNYSFIVRVKVSGVQQAVFDLEVPLQVVHTSPRTIQSTAALPASETFLEPRRGSEASWFSDESLVSFR